MRLGYHQPVTPLESLEHAVWVISILELTLVKTQRGRKGPFLLKSSMTGNAQLPVDRLTPGKAFLIPTPDQGSMIRPLQGLNLRTVKLKPLSCLKSDPGAVTRKAAILHLLKFTGVPLGRA